MSENATEILFYHLESQPLERVLPQLLEKTMERGWRAVIKAGSKERLEAIDLMLWTYRDGSFLPHGTSSDKFAEHQPIYLTLSDDVPNSAGVAFIVDGADGNSTDGFVRVVHLFDGHDDDAVAGARAAWKNAVASGSSCTYWQQDDSGRWQKKA